MIEPPASAAGSNRPLLFRGSGSHDDDPGDAIAAWSWKASPPAGLHRAASRSRARARGPTSRWSSPAPAITRSPSPSWTRWASASAVRTLRVRVEATARPSAPRRGAPTSRSSTAAAARPSPARPGTGSPRRWRSRPRATGPPGVTFTYRWTVELPPGAVARSRPPRITFSPDDTAAEPNVRIETAGTAIAGRYTFVVAATDSRGMVAVGRQRVDVGNRPPVVSGRRPSPPAARLRAPPRRGSSPPATPPSPPGATRTATRSTPLGFTSTRSGDGGNVFDVQGLGDHARVTVVVPLREAGRRRLPHRPGRSAAGGSGRRRRERRPRPRPAGTSR